MTTQVEPITERGEMLGTFQYMAPEQLEGREVDARTDIFSFGALLFEMLTGRPAFQGRSRASLIASILSSEPPSVMAMQPETPPALDRLVRKCMAKDPDQRWQNAGDLASELRWIAESGGQMRGSPPARKMSRNEKVAWGTAIALLATTLTNLAVNRWRKPEEPQVVHSSILAPPNVRMSITGDFAGPPAISPDGRQIAFVGIQEGRSMIWVRPLETGAASPLPGTQDATFPFWSADGRSLGFFAEGKLKRVDTSGGPAVTIADAPGGRGGSWNRDDVIVFVPDIRSGVYRVAATGGPVVELTRVQSLGSSGHTTHRWPQFLPDGKHFLFVAARHTAPRAEENGLYMGSLEGGEPQRIVASNANGAYASGYLLYLREKTLLAQRFDPASGELSGETFPLAEGVQYSTGTWQAVFTVSDNGVLAYQTGSDQALSRLAWFDRQGKMAQSLGQAGPIFDLELSPDGNQIAMNVGDPISDIWLHDLKRDIRTRLTFGNSLCYSPVWSPDGRWVAFASDLRTGAFSIQRKRSSGEGEPEILYRASSSAVPADWSPDGRSLLFVQGVPGAGTQQDIYLLPLEGKRTPRPLLNSAAPEYDGQFSPDGRWLAYTARETNQEEVYVVPFPGPGGKWQVSNGGGGVPRWRRDGRELYFSSLDGTVMAVPVVIHGERLDLGVPKALVRANLATVGNPYDVSANGQRFLINQREEPEVPPITLVVNWTSELKK
jgi:Tol biopolymer transport system component